MRKTCWKILKSKDFWEGNENLDEIGMTIFPSGYSTKEGELIGEGQKQTSGHTRSVVNIHTTLKGLTAIVMV